LIYSLLGIHHRFSLSLTHTLATRNLNRGEVGEWDTTNRQDGIPIIPISQTFRHPNYVGGQYDDIMVVQLERSVPNPTLIELNFNRDLVQTTGVPLNMLGFGSITDGIDQARQLPTILQQGPIESVSYDECAVKREPFEGGGSFGVGTAPDQTIVRPEWLCTFLELDGAPRPGHCFGDSGGPIIVEGSTVQDDLLVGVISG